jgi:hypothetical protein
VPKDLQPTLERLAQVIADSKPNGEESLPLSVALYFVEILHRFPEQMLLIGLNEAFGCAVLRIDKHDVLWIAPRRVD